MLFFVKVRTRENLRGVLCLKSIATISALHKLHKGIGNHARFAIGKGVEELVRDRARLTQVPIRALFNRFRGIVELEMTVAFDLVDHLVQIRHLNGNMVDVILVKQCPRHVIVLLLDSLVIGVGFDLLMDGLLVLTQEHAKTRVF